MALRTAWAQLIRRLAYGVLAALTAGGLAACGGGSTAGDGIAGLLALVPDTSETRQFVAVNDYAKARDAFAIPLPGDSADEEDISDYIAAVLSGQTGVMPGPWISGFSEHGFAFPDNREHLGFDVRNVEFSIMAGFPPGVLEVVKGRFNPQATERVIEGCSECPPPERKEVEGTEFYSWFGDHEMSLQDRLRPPAFDALGRGGRIAVLDSLVFRTVETPGMRALIRTFRGKEDSLADDSDLALAAEKMDSLEVYSGLLIGDTASLGADAVIEGLCANVSSRECRQIEDAITGGVGPLDEYEALGAGVGRDEDGTFNAVIFVYGSEDAAKRNARQFEELLEQGESILARRSWSEIVLDADVWAEDRTVIGKLRSISPALWVQAVHARDSLYMHE